MLRCSHCGVEFSEWAARCPSCREPADPVATPTSGAPTAGLGGHAAAPGDRSPRAGSGPESDPAPQDGGLPWRFGLPGPMPPPRLPPPRLPPASAEPELPPRTFTTPADPARAHRASPVQGNGQAPVAPAGPSGLVGFERPLVQPPHSEPPPGTPGQRAAGPEPGSKGRRKVSPALVIIGVAVIGLFVTLLASRNRKPSPSPPHVLGTQTQRPGPTATPAGEVSALLGYTLVAADAGADVAIAPFSGTRRAVAGLTAPGYPEVPVRTGGSVVVVTAGTAYALTPPFTAAPVP